MHLYILKIFELKYVFDYEIKKTNEKILRRYPDFKDGTLYEGSVYRDCSHYTKPLRTPFFSL